MNQEKQMPGRFGSQHRALIESVSGTSPARHPRYISISAHVNLENDWLARHALDWAQRLCRDAEHAATIGNHMAELDLLALTLQALTLVNGRHARGEESWS